MSAKCPKCNSLLIKIVHGKPTKEQEELAQKKKIFLATSRSGRYIGTTKPTYYCTNCNKSYYRRKAFGKYIEYDWIEKIVLKTSAEVKSEME